MEDAGWLKKHMFDYFLGVARRCGGHPQQAGGSKDRVLYWLRPFVCRSGIA
jgi:hypothetical protein